MPLDDVVQFPGGPAGVKDNDDGSLTVLHLPDIRDSVAGTVRDDFWWSIKLCRFGPGELDPYVPGIKAID